MICYFFIIGCQQHPEGVFARDRDPWVMRSVLDEEIRMVTLALNKDCYVAYNTENCALYKLWRGGVHWDGAVFNNVKTVQPVSWGETYYEKASNDKPWKIKQNGELIAAAPQFKGYLIENDQITFKYQLAISDDNNVTIFEQPEFLRLSNGKVGFQRLFRTEGMDDNLAIWNGDIQLPSNEEAIFMDYFESVPSISADPEQLRLASQNLLDRNGCTTCHEIDEQTIGPSYRQMAGKYGSDPDRATMRELSRKVSEGSQGVWGNVPMMAHPDLNRDVIRGMINQILSYEPIDADSTTVNDPITETEPETHTVSNKPGFGSALEGLHPSLRLKTIHPAGLKPRVGGMDFLADGRLLISTWDSLGAVYALEGVTSGDVNQIKFERIAEGLAEPLGLKVVNDEIFVLQKQELTQLVDHDGDGITDEYRTICNSWGATADFHEFSYGLAYQDGFFYASLGLAMRLEETDLQAPDRGSLIKIAKDGTYETVISGLRQTNGIGFGLDNELFLTENQGQWVPACKVIHVEEGQFHGCQYRMGDFYKEMEMSPPAVWLPQDEIGNSPSQPVLIPEGTYKGQMLHGEITHGGLKRVFLEKINGSYQGGAFRFTQGLEAGINRAVWGPDNALYVGGAGMNGNWAWKGRQYGLQRLEFTDKIVFEVLKIQARPNGFDIIFTEPLAEAHGEKPDDYLIQQWWYEATPRYGGDKMDLESITPSKVIVSQDRKRVHLEIPGLKEKSVVYFLLNEALRSSAGQSLWSGEAWYTLNKIPGQGNYN